MKAELFALFLASSLRLAIPLLLAAIGELVSEKSGIVNMSLEGMMLAGAFGAALGASLTGSPYLGLLIGILFAMPVALLQTVLTNTLGANQIVTGIGINILVYGLTTFGYRGIFGARSREVIPGFDTFSLPILGDLPIIGSLFQQIWMVWLALFIFAFMVLIFSKTGLGIIIQATGNNPDAVSKSGISVVKMRHGSILFTGVMAGLGGAFISIGDIHTFTEGITNGAGYLAIVAVIFGNWTLWRTLFACLLFGAATALQFQVSAFGIDAPSALLIMMPYLLAFVAVAGLVGRQTAPRALTQPYRS